MSNYASPISKLISYKKHKKMLKYFLYIYTEFLKTFFLAIAPLKLSH